MLAVERGSTPNTDVIVKRSLKRKNERALYAAQHQAITLHNRQLSVEHFLLIENTHAVSSLLYVRKLRNFVIFRLQRFQPLTYVFQLVYQNVAH